MDQEEMKSVDRIVELSAKEGSAKERVRIMRLGHEKVNKILEQAKRETFHNPNQAQLLVFAAQILGEFIQEIHDTSKKG